MDEVVAEAEESSLMIPNHHLDLACRAFRLAIRVLKTRPAVLPPTQRLLQRPGYRKVLLRPEGQPLQPLRPYQMRPGFPITR